MSVVLSEFLIPGWADGVGAPASPVNGVDLPCHFVDPELFFAETQHLLEAAKAFCRTCPLVDACLDGAISRNEPCGVARSLKTVRWSRSSAHQVALEFNGPPLKTGARGVLRHSGSA
jgi:WhiB family redox-sensing transcriptional regulator